MQGMFKLSSKLALSIRLGHFFVWKIFDVIEIFPLIFNMHSYLDKKKKVSSEGYNKLLIHFKTFRLLKVVTVMCH